MFWIIVGALAFVVGVVGACLTVAAKRADREHRIAVFIQDELAKDRDSQRRNLQVLQQKNGYLRDVQRGEHSKVGR